MDSGPVPFDTGLRASQNDDTLSRHSDNPPAGGPASMGFALLVGLAFIIYY